MVNAQSCNKDDVVDVFVWLWVAAVPAMQLHAPYTICRSFGRFFRFGSGRGARSLKLYAHRLNEIRKVLRFAAHAHCLGSSEKRSCCGIIRAITCMGSCYFNGFALGLPGAGGQAPAVPQLITKLTYPW